MTPTREAIDDFLRQRRIAVVGVSREPRDFSRAVLRAFAERGYDTVPVNPRATELGGEACFASLREVAPPVDGVLVMTPAGVTEGVVRDCLAVGVKRIWLHRGAGRGAVSKTALALCREAGVKVVPGACPMMFLDKTGFAHKLHGFVLRAMGRFPH